VAEDAQGTPNSGPERLPGKKGSSGKYYNLHTSRQNEKAEELLKRPPGRESGVGPYETWSEEKREKLERRSAVLKKGATVTPTGGETGRKEKAHTEEGRVKWLKKVFESQRGQGTTRSVAERRRGNKRLEKDGGPRQEGGDGRQLWVGKRRRVSLCLGKGVDQGSSKVTEYASLYGIKKLV